MKKALSFCVTVFILTALVVNAISSSSSSSMTPLTPLWDNYISQVTSTRIQERCIPFKISPIGKPKGLIALFHGYTACPNAYSSLVTKLQDDGFIVVSFLTLGHGREIGDCEREGAECLDDGTPVELLPTSAGPYLEFVRKANAIVKETLIEYRLSTASHVVGALGLSFGSPLSLVAAIEGNTGHNNNIYNRVLVVDSFFGVSVPGLDAKVSECTGSTRDCIREFVESALSNVVQSMTATDESSSESISPDVVNQFTDLLEISFSQLFPSMDIFTGGYAQLQASFRFLLDLISEDNDIIPGGIVSELLEKSITWGDRCKEASKPGATGEDYRGGYCTTKVKHFVGVHSFGNYALSRLPELSLDKVHFIDVERDGFTRNGITYGAMKASSSVTTHNGMCMYRVDKDCETTVENSNECGMPHSCFSIPENRILAPYALYWLDDLVLNISEWFSSGKYEKYSSTSPMPLLAGASSTSSIDKAVCYDVDGNSDPPMELFGEIAKYVEVRLSKPFPITDWTPREKSKWSLNIANSLLHIVDTTTNERNINYLTSSYILRGGESLSSTAGIHNKSLIVLRVWNSSSSSSSSSVDTRVMLEMSNEVISLLHEALVSSGKVMVSSDDETWIEEMKVNGRVVFDRKEVITM